MRLRLGGIGVFQGVKRAFETPPRKPRPRAEIDLAVRREEARRRRATNARYHD